jgi:O-Antigen ligase
MSSSIYDDVIRIRREDVPDLPTRVVVEPEDSDDQRQQTSNSTDRQSAARNTHHPRTRQPRRWNGTLISVAVVGLSALAGLFSPILSLSIVAIAIAITAVIYIPVQPLMLIVAFLSLAIDNPRASPANGNWSPWFQEIAGLLYRSLKPLPVGPLDLLAIACAVRGLIHVRQESKVRIGRERVFSRIIALALGTMVFTFMSGILRGGDIKQSVYQGRVFIWIPCFAIGIATVADMAFLRKLKNVLLLAAGIKGLTSVYVAATVSAKSEKSPLDFVTTHGDSVTYTMVFSFILAAWVAGVDKRFRKHHGLAMFLTIVGLYLNERRIAFVGMAFAVVIMYFDAIPERQRTINRTLSRFILPGILYMAIAFSGVSRNAIFRPALSLRSVVVQDDRSSSTRDVENFNLFYTFRTNPLIGIGYGHEYIEISVGDYIGDVFPQYKYLPHNSLLGLFAYGGIVAGIGYYVMFPASLYLGLLATKRKYTPERWAYSMMGAGGIAAVLIQGFGDVGFHDQIVGVLGGIAVGICGALYSMPDTEKALPKPIDQRAAVRLEPAS